MTKRLAWYIYILRDDAFGAFDPVSILTLFTRQRSMNNNNEVKLLSARRVSEYLNLSLRTVQRLSQKGKIKGIRIGSRWKYYESDIKKYLTIGTDLLKAHAKVIHASSERRLSPRINCFIPCQIEVNIPKRKEIYAQGNILNISEGGLFLDNPGESINIKPDDPVSLYFNLSGKGVLEANGRVLRKQNKGLAVKFRNISKNLKMEIRHYVG